MAQSARTFWTNYGKKHLMNRKIVDVRYMTQAEMKQLDWHRKALIMILDNGSIVFPSRDDEGNDGGALFGQNTKGEDLTFPVM